MILNWYAALYENCGVHAELFLAKLILYHLLRSFICRSERFLILDISRNTTQKCYQLVSQPELFFYQIDNIKICFVFEDSFPSNAFNIFIAYLFLVFQGDSLIYSIKNVNSY